MLGIERILDLIQSDPNTHDKNKDVFFNKFFNEIRHKANEMGLLSKCRLCGKNIDGKANSHSIPQSILKNIKTEGHYCQITCALGDNLVYGPFGRINRTGLNNTGTFHLLCKECENKTFRDYEQKEFLEKIGEERKELLTDKILAQIMLKSALLERYKKEFSRNMTILMNEIAKNQRINFRTSTVADELNLKEYDFYINKCLDVIDGRKTDEFEIFYFDVLDYPSSFASQTLLPIQKTVTNEIINDVYNFDTNYHIVLPVFVVFPLKTNTILLAYCLKSEAKRLEPFINYFNTLNMTSKRKMFQSVLFMYTEEVYTNESKIKEIINDEQIMSYIKCVTENATIFNPTIKANVVLHKPDLVAPNNYRKTKFIL